MSNSSDTRRFPPHRIGVAGRARTRAFDGTGASALSRVHATLAVVAAALGVLLFTTAPVQAETSGEQIFGQVPASSLATPASATPAVAKVSGSHVLGAPIGGPGSGAGELSEPGAVAVDEGEGPAAGDVYVVDRGNNRIERFTSTGEFISTFGWGVIRTGASGTGDLKSGSDEVTGVITTEKVFLVGQPITGTGIPAGATIVAVGAGTITLSAPAEASGTGTGVALSVAEGAGVVPTNDQQLITVTATGGTYTLTFDTPNPSPSKATTGNMPFNATAGEVQSALEGLANIGAGNVTVTGSTGGPYTATFQGARFADGIVTQLQANSSDLTGGSEQDTHETVVYTSQTGGGGFEVCTVAADCQAGIAGLGVNQFSNLGGIAIDNDPSSPSLGDLYVIDNTHLVIDKFRPSGAYLSQITEGKPGEELGQFDHQEPFFFLDLKGVAVANNGDLLVYYERALPGTNPLDFLDSYNDQEANAFVENRQLAQSGCQCGGPISGGLAVDSKGNLYVTHDEVASITKLEASGELAGASQAEKEKNRRFGDEEGVSGLAVEQSSDDVYIDDGATVDRFSEGGSLIESLGSGQLQGGTGVAASSQSGEVYVADATADVVDVFSESLGTKIEEESVTNVGASSATLQAKINPNSTGTTYHFEYDTTPYETSAPHGTSTPEVSIGAGGSVVPVSAQLKGLQPDTTYYYRVVAGSEVKPGEVKAIEGPGRTFTTAGELSSVPEVCSNARARSEQPFGQVLSDCRAYEMVSPLEKNGTAVSFAEARASVSGEALAYLSAGSFSEPVGAGQESRYLARRGSGGWLTQNISTPRDVKEDVNAPAFEELLFTPSLSAGLTASAFYPLVAGEAAGYNNLYVADLASRPVSYQTVSNVTPPGIAPYEEGSPGGPQAAGGSTDLSHVVFEDYKNLTEGATGKGSPDDKHVYEWAAGKLSQVDISPTGGQFKGIDQVGAPGKIQPSEGDPWHAVSADGLRVFFTGVEKEGSEVGQLYVRENPMSPTEDCAVPGDACTVELSKSQKTNGTGPGKTDSNGPQPAFYRDADAEGTRVFFTSRAELTNDANTGSADDSANLYEYDFERPEGERLRDLTVDKAEAGGAAVLGLVAAGENAGEENSYVYFVANGVLSEGENAEHQKAEAGDCKENEVEGLTGEHTCNLYVAHYNAGKWETKFVAALLGGDTAGLSITNDDEKDWVDFETDVSDFGQGQHAVRVTPDGTTLAFGSERSLTGYDNTVAGGGSCGHDEELGGQLSSACPEVYLYAAVTGKLVCASCDPSGVRPAGPGELGGHERDNGAGVLLGESPFYVARNISEDGERLFFQSSDPLVPHDSNGKLDVYEWEAAGEGSCVQAAGCVFAISDVAGDHESHFVDASPDGDDAFIATTDQLLPSDTDTREDIYDVRVGGGFPVTAAAPVCSNSDSCKAPVSAQPAIFGAPSSATFSGPGNATTTAAAAVTSKKKTAAEVKAGQLSKALKACKKDKGKKKRAACEKQARKKYGATKASKTKKAKKAGNERRASR